MLDKISSVKVGNVNPSQKSKEKPVLSKTESDENKTKKDEQLSWFSKVMRNLALANMRIAHNNSAIAQQQDQLWQQQIAQQMAQQALQDHMTAVQMTTPGMGII